MSKFYDTNLNITKARISNGDIVELEINDKVVNLNSSDLESNKDVSIDVSEYSNPVEITPTSGKDGMEKATVTLTNIPTTVTVESLSITENGTYTAPSGKAYSPITVNVPTSNPLYIYHYEEGSDSLLCEASSFENITVGMKGVMSSGGSEYMTGVACTEKTAESATFTNGNYTIWIASSDIPISLSSILG